MWMYTSAGQARARSRNRGLKPGNPDAVAIGDRLADRIKVAARAAARTRDNHPKPDAVSHQRLNPISADKVAMAAAVRRRRHNPRLRRRQINLQQGAADREIVARVVAVSVAKRPRRSPRQVLLPRGPQ